MWKYISVSKRKSKNSSFLETNMNEDTSYQNLLDIEKAVLKAKFIDLQIFVRKEESPHRRKEIIKVKSEINELESPPK